MPDSYSAESLLTDSSDSDKSTRDTIKQMYRIVRSYTASQTVVDALQDALAGLNHTAPDREKISRIFYWIRKEIKFTNDPIRISKLLPSVKDPTNTELLIVPDLLLKLKSGDCDCFSMLASAMLRSCGIFTRFITVAADKNYPTIFSHVYLEAFDKQHRVWIPFDASHGHSPDWEHKEVTRRYVWTD